MSSLETKTLSGEEALADLHRAFAAFKDTNEERIAQIETRMGVDALTEEKLQRIDRSIDETKRRIDRVALDVARPRLASTPTKTMRLRASIKRLSRSICAAAKRSGLKALELKALSAGSGPDGGYLVPTPAEQEIIAPSRAHLADSRQSPACARSPPIRCGKRLLHAGPGGRLGGGGRPASADAAASRSPTSTFPAMELYAMPAATQTLLDDSAVDLEQWIADEVQTVFAEQEGAAFVNGNGINKPKGFLAYRARSPMRRWSLGQARLCRHRRVRRLRRQQSRPTHCSISSMR